MNKIISKTVVLMSAVAMFGWVGMVQAAVNLPVVSSFDDVGLPTGWTLNAGSSSLGTDTIEGANVRTLGELTTVTLAVNASSKTYANTWIQVFAKAQPSNMDPDVTGASGAFYVNNSGSIRVRENGAWATIPSYTVATNTWIGFVVHADYVNKKWDLFCNGGAAWDALTNTFVRVNATPLRFNNTANKMSALKVSTGKGSAMDIVAVSPSVRAITADTADCDKVLVCTYPSTTSVAGDVFKLPVWVAAYNSPNNSMADPIGQHLLSGLAYNDAVYVFDPIMKSYGTFVSDGNGAWQSGGDDPLAYTNVGPATAITLARAGNTPSCGFYDYNDTTAYVEADKVVASPSPTAPRQALAGTWKPLQPTLAGLQELAWHGNANETLQQMGTKMAAQGAIINGDRVYLAVNNIFIELYWNTAANPDAWYEGANLSAYNSTVIDQKSFWLARQGPQNAYSVPMGQ